MRLDKYLSNATDYSRSEIKRLIRAGEVEVNGNTTTSPALHLADDAQVMLSGMPISKPRPRYFMLHKPAGYVSVTKDSEHPTAIDLMVDEPRSEDLQIVGRLDLDATGLLLLTDDGIWNHTVTSPKSDCNKVYRVELAEPVPDNAQKKFQAGVWLNNEKRRTLPAKLEILTSTSARLTIAEGKYHQVKRMFAALGNKVIKLHREQIGNILLDATLQPGEYRALTDDEVESVMKESEVGGQKSEAKAKAKKYLAGPPTSTNKAEQSDGTNI